MSGIVLDAGALIAFERGDRDIQATIKATARSRDPIFVPSTVLAQVWRARQTQALLAIVLRSCVIYPFDVLASRVGELCGKARTSDIVDAHVAIVAKDRDVTAIYTSDPDDIRHLLRVSKFPDRVVEV